MPGPFSFESEAIDLPKGAVARTHRRMLRWRDRPLFSLSQGPYRPYIYPLYTPSGQQVLEESPADHPHHNGIWVAADHVHCRFPLDRGRHEDGTYGFFVNESFQGRAPGTIETTDVVDNAIDEAHFRLRVANLWRGPREWGAPDGRVLIEETRTIDIKVGKQAHVVDIVSEIAPTEWDLVIGPTRHAYFGIRVADSIRVTQGGQITDASGNQSAADVSDDAAAWVDFSGPLANGATVGIAALTGAMPAHRWFATEWGVMHLNPFAAGAGTLARGERCRLAMRLVIHDGAPRVAELDALQRALVGGA